MAVSRRAFIRHSSLAAAATLAVPGLARATSALALDSVPPRGPRRSDGGGATDLRTPLDEYIETRWLRSHATAVAVAAMYGGRVVYSRGFGIRNLDTGQPTTADTAFMLASISKTIMSVAAMQAWERGFFDLDDDLNDLLGFPVRNPRFPNVRITPRMLLVHTNSIRDRWGAVLTPLYVQGDSPIPLGEFLESYLVPGGMYYSASDTYSKNKPGTRYSYSNIGAALAGYLVEATTGIPFDQWCIDNIFEPLGMDRTSWHLAGLDQDKIAMPYRLHRKSGRYDPWGFYGYPDYPDGQLRTTPISLAKFLGMVASRGQAPGGPRILGRETVDLMMSNQLAGLGLYWRQGLIWYRVVPPTTGGLWGHTGGDWGVATMMFFRPSDGAGAVVLSNTGAGGLGEWDALQDIRNRLILQAHKL